MKKVIYSIINLKNGKQYIGSTSNYSRRKNRHLYMLKSNKHHSLSLQASWNKSSEEYYKFIVLEELDELTDMYIREQYYMDLYKSYNNKYGYNMSKNAIAPYGTNNIKKVYQFLLNGELVGEYNNCTIAADSLNIDCSGLSKCARGKYRYYGGYIWSYDNILTQERIDKANNPVEFTKERRDKISVAGKARTDNKKAILQYDKDMNFIREWQSNKEASIALKMSTGQICDVLKGNRPHTRGIIFKYKI